MFPIYSSTLSDNKIDICYITYSTSSLYMVADSYETINKVLKLMDKNSPSDQSISIKKQEIYNIGSDFNIISIGQINPTRTFDTLVFNKKNEILNTLESFNKNLNYDNCYIQKNLGFIVYGVPGSGKTSFIKALCNYFKRDAMIFDMTLMSNRTVFSSLFRKSVKQNHVIVFDEFDHILEQLNNDKNDTMNHYIELSQLRQKKKIIKNKDNKNESKELVNEVCSPVDISFLLTLLDGIVEDEGRIIVATTNSPNKIPKALLRPGRFDIKLELTYFKKNEINELLTKILEREIPEHKIPEDYWSPVEIIRVCNTFIMEDDKLNKIIYHLETEKSDKI